MLVDPTVPNIDWNAETVGEIAGRAGQFVWSHHILPLLIILAYWYVRDDYHSL
jgi:hypothetical protein